MSSFLKSYTPFLILCLFILIPIIGNNYDLPIQLQPFVKDVYAQHGGQGGGPSISDVSVSQTGGTGTVGVSVDPETGYASVSVTGTASGTVSWTDAAGTVHSVPFDVQGGDLDAPSSVTPAAAANDGTGFSFTPGDAPGDPPSDPGFDPGTISTDPGGPNEGNTPPGDGDTPPPPPEEPSPSPICVGNCNPVGAFGQFEPESYCLAPEDRYLRVNWVPAGNVTFYKLYYMDSEVGTAQPPTGIVMSGRDTRFTFTNTNNILTPGKNYSFIIRGFNTSGYYRDSNEGLWSHQVFINFTAYPLCKAPEAFNLNRPTEVCTGANGDSYISLTWGNSNYATKYRVQYKDLTTGAEGIYSDRGLNRDETVRGLVRGRRYAFRIESTNSLGTVYSNGSNWSDAIYGANIFPDCSRPTVNMSLTKQTASGPVTVVNGVYPPLHIKQKEQVTLAWNTNNGPLVETNACTASIPTVNPAPTQALLDIWQNKTKNYQGSENLPQIIKTGDYRFNLSCNSRWGISNTTGIVLSVDPLQKPYIQTTGGDVHTNESINIPR